MGSLIGALTLGAMPIWGPAWLSPEVVERVEHYLAIVSQNREGNSALAGVDGVAFPRTTLLVPSAMFVALPVNSTGTPFPTRIPLPRGFSIGFAVQNWALVLKMPKHALLR
jgi:hypothetical protein